MTNPLETLETEFHDLESRYQVTYRDSRSAEECDAFSTTVDEFIGRVNAYGRTLDLDEDHADFADLLRRLGDFVDTMDDRFVTVRGTRQARNVDLAIAAFPDTLMSRSTSESRWARTKKEQRDQGQEPDVLNILPGLDWGTDPAWQHAVGEEPPDPD